MKKRILGYISITIVLICGYFMINNNHKEILNDELNKKIMIH